jgi:hypothetical protein
MNESGGKPLTNQIEPQYRPVAINNIAVLTIPMPASSASFQP